MPLNKTLLEIIACPICKSPLHYQQRDGVEELLCCADQLAFQVVDHIPVMLAEEARKLTSEEVAEVCP